MTADTYTYTASQAAKLAEISSGSLRNYVQSGRFGEYYASLFSAGAAPPPGQPRQFTTADVVLLRYIRTRTQTGLGHAQVAAEIAGGALESFDWQPPEESAQEVRAARQAAQEDRQEAPQVTAALALAGQWAGLLEAARAREAALTDRLIAAEARAARAEGELAAVRSAQGRPWYRRIFS